MTTALAASLPPFAPLPVGSDPTAVAVADVNGDGKPDLVTANDGDDTVSVLLGNGDGTFQAAADLRRRAVARLRGGGGRQRRRQARPRRRQRRRQHGERAAGQRRRHLPGRRRPSPSAVDPYSVAVADVNGDGKPDLVTANYGDNTVSVLLGNGDGTFQPAADLRRRQ